MKFFMINSLIAIFSFFLFSCNSTDYIPKDAVEFQGHYYKVFQSASSWKEAVEKCHLMGGQLAAVKSQEVNDFIVKISEGRCLWLGASDEISEGEWLWRDGSKMLYSNWASHEPDNWYDGTEHTVVIGWPGYKKGEWGDTQGHYRKPITGFVCQW